MIAGGIGCHTSERQKTARGNRKQAKKQIELFATQPITPYPENNK